MADKACPFCNGTMRPKAVVRKFRTQEFERTIRTVTYVCDTCGEIMYTLAEAKRIENELKKDRGDANGRPD